MRKKGLILAAGMSSRMGALKPIMKINGYPMIEWAIMNMRNGGIEDICVVLGKEAGRITPFLIPYQVSIVENKEYSSTDMFASIRLGLESLMSEDTEFICILPCDNPLIQPHTIKLLQKNFVKEECEAVIPTYHGVTGHPSLISMSMAEKMMTETAEKGMQGLFLKYANSIIEQECDDPGICMDADSITDFVTLSEYGRRRFGLAQEQVVAYWEEQRISQDVRVKAFEFRKAVVDEGMRLNERGAALDLTLFDSGALFSALFDGEKDAENKVIRLLREEGFEKIAEVYHDLNQFPIDRRNVGWTKN